MMCFFIFLCILGSFILSQYLKVSGRYMFFRSNIKLVKECICCIYSIWSYLPTYLGRCCEHQPLWIRHWSLLNIKDAISCSWRSLSSRSCCTNVRAGLPRPRLPWLAVHNTTLDWMQLSLDAYSNDQPAWVSFVWLYLWLWVLQIQFS